ncbi:hypothetical protein [Flavobacterium wongokense]|uniref:hypothetical protein n=1 Tax=Flavobacterium wongokense TaxID=2910674 RepID=UPI001F1E4EF0|nr:hypothetical protein [Flavobacterium sp. WG47]MCF6132012.1 hypothetical protein [Flavobacterium sp. WG47]
MKKLTVSILLLLSSINSFGCGYSPYGEDIRYCLFHPDYFNFNAYFPFYYNANQFGLYGYDSDEERTTSFYESNILDWYNFAQKKVPLSEIEKFNYHLKLTDISAGCGNAFLDYLYKNKKSKALRYLMFSKKCEDFNTLQTEDVWERKRIDNSAKIEKFYDELFAAYKAESSDYLKRKYAFQCIRFCYYTNDATSINAIFEETFKGSKKDYLYYWSLYFTCFSSDADRDVKIANLFAYSPEKALAVYHYFHESFSLEKALAQAKTKSDVANCYAYASAQKTDRNLENLKIMYGNNANSRILDFLLLREINKIEDWIYTPYYSNYLPSIEETNYYWSGTEDKITTEVLRQRSEKDRLYAQELLDFVNTVDFSKVNNRVLWKSAQIQLLFMTRKFDECLAKVDAFQKQHSNEKIFQEVEQIKALCLTANQPYGKAIVKDEVKPIYLKYNSNSRFVFALGRELEFLGNLPDGMAMISSINKDNQYYMYSEGSTGVEWQGNRLKTTDNLSYFYEYFDYLDFVYSANQMQVIVNKLNTDISDDFEKKLYHYLLSDKNYLTDLLGTKYLRENQLNKALVTFRSLSKKYWEENYNPWEHDRYKEELQFDQNPFYSFKYTEDFIPHKEKFIVTKLSVTEHLISYLKKANNPKTADRDYYYFLAANCFLNMDCSGNSWMMRRYQSSSSSYNEGYYDVSYIDEKEYRTSQLAQHYYQLAFDQAKTPKFKALCLRMIDYAEFGYPDDFAKMKAAYPDYYSELSSCMNLDSYFNSRR